MQFDYRSVYYSVLKDWFRLSQSQLESVFGGPAKTAGHAAQYHDLFRPETITSTKHIYTNERVDKLRDIFPNPVIHTGTIPLSTSGGHILLELLDTDGRNIRTITEKNIGPGYHEILFERQNLKPGAYMIRMREGEFQATKKLVVH